MGIKQINCSTLRQLWTVIENTQSNIILSLNDNELVKQLLNQLNILNPLNGDEVNIVADYILSRISLIRDLAEARAVML